MKKKLVFIASACVVLILLGGLNTVVLYSTEYLSSKSGYIYSVSEYTSWWDCNWSYCKKIIIDHTKVQADQTDFPVLLYRVTDVELATYAQPDGDDISFVDKNNVTQYKHEIEKYNSTTGEILVWVNVDSISSTEDTILYMYYGNPSCNNQQNITATWDSSYRLVQHLNESSGTLYDSTSYNNDGTNNGATYNDSSKIDGGHDFDGTSNISCITSSSLNITSQITLEGWVKDPPLIKKEIKDIDNCEIKIIKAEHLNKNRESISDIYNEVNTKDDIWSEPILNGDYVKITFEKPLRNINDITIFARSNDIANIEIYTENDDTLISKFEKISDKSWHKIRLSNLSGKHSVFYLRTVGSSVEYDYIVDPPPSTSVNNITPYWQASSPLIINATNTTPADNVTLWYRYSTDNFTGGFGWEDDDNVIWHIEEFTSGSGSWEIPAAVNKIDILVVAGGGGSGKGTTSIDRNGGGGGAGGLVWITNVTKLGSTNITQGNTISYSVGVGGAGSTSESSTGGTGSDSVFGNLTAKGGGGGGSRLARNGDPGGSGGGGGVQAGATGAGGTGTQPSQAGWSGIFGFGNNGATAVGGDAGGGGGAGGVGIVPTGGAGMNMSDYFGTDYGISGIFAKGGNANSDGSPGQANTGYGGNARANNNGGDGANGGSGIILIKWREWVVWENASNPDMSSPWNWSFDFPNGAGYYEFYSIGNKSGENNETPPNTADARCGYDNVLPTSSVNTITPYWKTTSPLAITITASDTGYSGLKNATLYYYNSTDNNTWNGPYKYGNTNTTPWTTPIRWNFNFPNGTGYYRFYSITYDNATNQETLTGNDTICGYDNIAPTSSVNTITPYWKTTSPLAITITASDTGYSGLKNATLYYYNSTDNNTWNGPYKYGNTNTTPWTTPIRWNFNFPNGTGYYRFYSITYDNATNQETLTGNDTICGYDNIAPSSNVDAISPYLKTTRPQVLTATASDTGTSGLKNVTLFHRFSTDNSTWGAWTKWNDASNPDTDPWITCSWNFNFPNGKGYYEFYSRAYDNASNYEDAPANADAICQYATMPSVFTNSSTGVEETNATLRGYLADNGSLDTTCGFWYDTTPGGKTNNITIGTIANHSTFSYNATGLTPGQIYYYTAWAYNSIGFNDTASELSFLTKPNESTSLHAQTNNSQTIFLTWTKGAGANNTVIQRKTGSYPTSVTDGTNVYNGTGTQYEDIGLNEGTTYYYRAWSYTSWGTLHQWSDDNASASNTTSNIPTITNPYPTNGSAEIPRIPTLNITVNDRDGDNMTIIWYSNSSGTWLEFGRNTSVGNGTYHQTNINFSEYGTTYWWNVTVIDEMDTNITWYYFTTITKSVIILSDESPTNGSLNVYLNPTLEIQINNSKGYQMNITWYWGTDSSCPNFIGTNLTIINGTYRMNNDNNFSLNDQIYYWRVIVNDGSGTWENATYHFTTIAKNKIVVNKGDNSYSLEINPNGTTLYGFINGNYAETSIDTNWHYVTLTYDGSQIRLYKDGNLEDNTSLNDNINTNANNLRLGEYLSGTLDEIRISSTARNAAWINTTYLNTNSPTTFATFGNQIGILTTWSYRKQITINASMVDDNLINFPILISTTDTDIKNNAQYNGYDILFTSSTVNWETGSYTQKLNHEIEKYTSATGELVAWVNITQLSDTTNTIIYMYYGNTLCTANRQNPTGVWDDNFIGVWHLSETPTDGGTHYDSTLRNHDLTFHDADSDSNTNAAGIIDGADDLNGDADYMHRNHHSDFNFSTFTLECWVALDDKINTHFMINKQLDNYTDRNFALYSKEATGVPVLSVRTTSGTNVTREGTTDLTSTGWHYIAGTNSGTGTDTYLYVNGTIEASGLMNANPPVTQAAPLMMGRENSSVTPNYWDGKIDEIRISKVSRNSSWINTTYNTISSPNSFLTFGTQKTRNVAPTQTNPSPTNGATGISLNPQLSITVNDTNSDTMNVTFRTNATGAWASIGSNNSVNNGTYIQTTSDMDSYNTRYWWSINLTDGIIWTNSTYSFTTYSLLTIRPNTVGRSTQLTAVGEAQNYLCVDEVNQNGDTDYVYSDNQASYINDTYNLTDHTTETGSINFIRIYLCGKENGSAGAGTDNSMKPVIYTNSNYYDSDTAVTLTDSFVTSSWTHTVNPITSAVWTWSEIDDLEVGVALVGQQRQYSNCTQVYVEVVYTPS